MTRMEYRGGDLSGSVHLYGTVLLAAGLKGIEDKLVPPPNANFNVEKLSALERHEKGIDMVPTSFKQTVEILQKSSFLKETLGEDMVNYMIQRNLRLSSSQCCQKCHPPKIH